MDRVYPDTEDPHRRTMGGRGAARVGWDVPAARCSGAGSRRGRDAVTLFTEILDIRGDRPPLRRSRLFSVPSDVAPHGGEAARLLIRRYFVGMISVGEVTSRGHDTHVTEPAGATLIAPRSGRIVSVGPDGTPRVAEPGGMVFFAPNRRSTRVEPTGPGAFTGIPVIVPQEDLLEAAARLDLGRGAVRGLGGFALAATVADGPEARALVDLALALHAAIEADDPRFRRAEAHRSVSRLLAERMIDLLGLGQAIDLPAASDGRAAARHVRNALDFMHAAYGSIVTISDVAVACGTSLRTLEASFREVWSETPVQALTAIRLDAARRALLGADPPASVTEAALLCGLGHFGRFSVGYRARFDERPSETLRRTVASTPNVARRRRAA